MKRALVHGSGSMDQAGRNGLRRRLGSPCMIVAAVSVAIASHGCGRTGEALARKLVDYGGERPDTREAVACIAERPLDDVQDALRILITEGLPQDKYLAGDILTHLELRGRIHGRPLGVLDDETVPANEPWLVEFLEETHRKELSYFLFDVAAFHPEARRVLRNAVAYGSTPLHRRTGVYILARSEGLETEDRDLIVAALDDEDLDVRARAAVCAGELCLAGGLPGLTAMLEDRTVVTSLVVDDCPFIGHGARPIAEAANFEPELRSVAAWAIQQITGKDFGYKTAYESRDHLDAIVFRIRSEYPSK